MVKIRLRRVGAKDQPSYRIVVADQRSPRDGRFIENIGHYNPRTEPETVTIDTERAAYWLSVGAQPTESVERLLRKAGAYTALEGIRGGTTTADESTGVIERAREVVSTVASTATTVAATVATTVAEQARSVAGAVADAARSAIETVTEAVSSDTKSDENKNEA